MRGRLYLGRFLRPEYKLPTARALPGNIGARGVAFGEQLGKGQPVDADTAGQLHRAGRPPPAQQCLSPIGEDLICRGLEKEIQLDFVRARTRPSAVHGGHSFIIEAAIESCTVPQRLAASGRLVK